MKYLIVATAYGRSAIVFAENQFTFQEMAQGHHVVGNGRAHLDPAHRRVTVEGPQACVGDAETLQALFFPS